MPAQFNALCCETSLHHAWTVVKAKGAAGGIDGISIDEFDKNKHRQIPLLVQELRSGQWKPLPYLEIEVAKTKNPDERRRLGMTSIRDKIVQQAIKSLIEPRLEHIFLGCSYGYRPGKGATRAIRRVLYECASRKYTHVLRLDIDNFFDTINHDILQRRLLAVGIEPDIVRLIMLCVKMGRVRQGNLQWVEDSKGVPQGAVLSPLMANLYMHSFDQFASSRNAFYIRYADDFLFLCPSQEEADAILAKTIANLSEKLCLSLNQPAIATSINDPFDFLGISIHNSQAFISDTKRDELTKSILSLEISDDGLSPRSRKSWDGMTNYYAKLLPQTELETFDSYLVQRFENLIEPPSPNFSSRTALRYAIGTITFLSKQYQTTHKQIVTQLVEHYNEVRHKDKAEDDNRKNQQLINQRKKEFRQKEVEASGLLVNKPGTFIGLTSRGITVSHKGKILSQHHKENLSQIVVTGDGIALSSNLIGFCLANRIPIDFFDHQGSHIGSFVNANTLQNSLWAEQSQLDTTTRNTLALAIITGKVANQHALLKYFHKYHKKNYPTLQPLMDSMNNAVQDFKTWAKNAKTGSDDFANSLMGHEAQVAVYYWDYLRELVSDDDVGFLHREHQGATDLVNSMLNYGYSILYVRTWQALLAAHLNPFDSLIHARRMGKPTLVYDMVEIFRSQVVDRVVIGLVQRHQDLDIRNGLLTDTTRQLLAKSVMERLSRYEKYHGEEIPFEQIITSQSRLLAAAIQGTDHFKPYVAKW